MKWAAVFGCVNLVLAVVLVGMRINAGGKKRQLAMLAQTLADLNVKQL